MADKPIRYEETTYGFNFGAANVERVASHKGYACIKVYTQHRVLNLYVTPQGRKIVVANERSATQFEKDEFTQEASQ